jgi:hypothetical protein
VRITVPSQCRIFEEDHEECEVEEHEDVPLHPPPRCGGRKEEGDLRTTVVQSFRGLRKFYADPNC